MGQMGLSRDDYLDSTPSEFVAIHRRFLEKVQKDRDAELTQKMLVGRLMVFRTLCPPPGKTIKLTDIWDLPGEGRNQETRNQKTEESTKRRFEELKKRFGT